MGENLHYESEGAKEKRVLEGLGVIKEVTLMNGFVIRTVILTS